MTSTSSQGDIRISFFGFNQNTVTVSSSSFGNVISLFCKVFYRLRWVGYRPYHFSFAEIGISDNVTVNEEVHPHAVGFIASVGVTEVMGQRCEQDDEKRITDKRIGSLILFSVSSKDTETCGQEEPGSQMSHPKLYFRPWNLGLPWGQVVEFTCSSNSETKMSLQQKVPLELDKTWSTPHLKTAVKHSTKRF